MSISPESSADGSQQIRLVQLAHHRLRLLERYPVPLAATSDAAKRAQQHLAGEPMHAEHLGEYLNHPDPDLDLSAQYNFVNDNENAMTAIDIVVLASGMVARTRVHTPRRGGARANPAGNSRCRE